MADRATWQEAYDRSPRRATRFETMSGVPLAPVYGPEGAELPGQFPYTRGPYASMYRSRLWTMRQFAGFGTAADTNERFKELLRAGGDGLSTAFDMPTLLGRDSDDPLAKGEVGRAGVAVDTLADMERLFADIDLGQVSTSMTINSPAAPVLAMYAGGAERPGGERARLSGTLQNDILKEYQAQKEYVFPPRPSVRLVTDVIRFCAAELPRWHPVSVSGYHIREAGSTAAQELAFTLANGFAYVEAALADGLDVDAFAPRLSFFFNAHSDFFEEIAKYRAARRIWHKTMTERFGAKNPRSWAPRFHTQTAACSLTAQQPYNNVVRTALQALAAVMGGTQSLHTNSLDEAWALPTEFAATLALRTQQIIAHESGVTNTADPLGGASFFRGLTNEEEHGAWDYIHRIDAQGGMVAAIERGYPQREIAEASYRYQQAVDRKEKIIVGVNDYVTEEKAIDILQIDETVAEGQTQRLRKLRAERSNDDVARRLTALRKAAAGTENTMPYIYEAVKAYATLGEICDTLRDVFGIYEEVAVT